MLVAACQTEGDIQSRNEASAFEAAAKQARECRAAMASRPEFQVLGAHMPLADIDQADLAQMLDVSLASPSEIAVLAAWSHGILQCRNEVEEAATRSGLSSYIPIILADGDRQDRIVVELVQRKISWGEAVLRLKASRTALVTGVSDEADRRGAALTRSAEAERANRAALMNAWFRLVP
jgi:hypothetical protein